LFEATASCSAGDRRRGRSSRASGTCGAAGVEDGEAPAETMLRELGIVATEYGDLAMLLAADG
jgi:hypothetical protein